MSSSRSTSSDSADSCGPGGLFSSLMEPEFDDPGADPSRELLFASISVNATLCKTNDGTTETFLSRITFHYVYNKTIHIESYLVHTGEAVSWARHARVLVCIGMCVLPWFWMGYGCRRIRVAGSLGFPGLCAFFNELYSHVLLEFLQASRLPAPELVVDDDDGDGDDGIGPSGGGCTRDAAGRVSSLSTFLEEEGRTRSSQQRERILVPLGGGKDSLVTLDLALEGGASVSLMYVADGLDEFEASWRLRRMAEMNPDVPIRIVKHEFIDERFERSARSFLHPTGHPWAALVLFDALLVCELYSIDRVQLGFERSADEGNGVFLHGKEINHQYDKSSAFLKRVKRFLPLLQITSLSNYSGGGGLGDAPVREDTEGIVGVPVPDAATVVVESPLAGMWDLEVARLFCTKPSLRRYHDVFISCNESDGLQNWCMKCEKCAFVYLVFSAWLDPEEVTRVFGGVDMFADGDAARERSLLSLVRRGAAKPYECVGTRWECRAAVELALRRRALLTCYWVDPHSSSTSLDVPATLERMCAEVFVAPENSVGSDSTRCLSKEALFDIARRAALSDEQSIIDRWLARAGEIEE